MAQGERTMEPHTQDITRKLNDDIEEECEHANCD